MTKPKGLPTKTSSDHDFLVRHGWRLIGCKREQYGLRYYWDHQDDTGNWSRAYIQGDALSRQQRINRLSMARKFVKRDKTAMNEVYP